MDAYEKATGRAKDILEVALTNSGHLDLDQDGNPTGWATHPDGGHEKDGDARLALAQSLAGGFADQHKFGHAPEEVAPTHAALEALGAEAIGEAGRTVRYDGAIHEDVPGLGTGSAVRVVRPGWGLPSADGFRTRVLLKTKVAK